MGQLAKAKAREVPALLQRRTALAWQKRWLAMITVTMQVATAESLLQPTSEHRAEIDEALPSSSELSGHEDCGALSHLPLRGQALQLPGCAATG